MKTSQPTIDISRLTWESEDIEIINEKDAEKQHSLPRENEPHVMHKSLHFDSLP